MSAGLIAHVEKLYSNLVEFSQQFITDDLDLEDNQQDIPPHVTELADKLYALAQSLPKEDPKFDQLSILVDNSLNGPGPKKVLIFSYFLHTLFLPGN